MSTQGLTQMNRHLVALREEIEELRDAVRSARDIGREATLSDVHRALAPALEILGRLESGHRDVSRENLSAALAGARPALGLEPRHRAGEILELFPEEAREDFSLDREIPDDATMVRVEILAPGWQRGLVKVTRPVGRVLEVADGS